MQLIMSSMRCTFSCWVIKKETFQTARRWFCSIKWVWDNKQSILMCPKMFSLRPLSSALCLWSKGSYLQAQLLQDLWLTSLIPHSNILQKSGFQVNFHKQLTPTSRLLGTNTVWLNIDKFAFRLTGLQEPSGQIQYQSTLRSSKCHSLHPFPMGEWVHRKYLPFFLHVFLSFVFHRKDDLLPWPSLACCMAVSLMGPSLNHNDWGHQSPKLCQLCALTLISYMNLTFSICPLQTMLCHIEWAYDHVT